MRADNGPEFIARAILRWTLTSGIDTALIDPGKPWQNGTDESFNGKFRDEAVVVIELWRRHYNGVRPYSSLRYLTPDEFKTKSVQLGMEPSTERAVLQQMDRSSGFAL